MRVVLSQQVSIKAASTHAHRLVVAYGEPLVDADGGLTHVFPSPERLAGLDPDRLALPRARRRTLIALIAALADGGTVLDPLALKPWGDHDGQVGTRYLSRDSISPEGFPATVLWHDGKGSDA